MSIRTLSIVNVQSSYDSAASAYAEHLFHELDAKPLDRHLLNRFAESTKGRGIVADIGCGPGHISRYLHELGVEIEGIDLSPEMVRHAISLCPGIEFRVGDMRLLDFASGSLAGIVAFYSIVHFKSSELSDLVHEFRRVLVKDGLALLAFHVGDESIHVEDMWSSPVSLDFHFHQPRIVADALAAASMKVIESIEREPYEGAEHRSRRCYLLAKAV